ncbi:hypothetical protein B0H10DRAFT_2342503 [Mycena sp. CBHHK59/15]|nr:hypothetical protein B0H10DRAFT_2342503 [Mycena sp. CBHHK59/15]
MRHNLEVAFPASHPPPSDGTLGPGFQIMVDEIKVEGRMRWDARSNMILGLCREHSKNFELEFLGVEQAEALHAGLADGAVHLASEATVIAVSSFSDIPVRYIAHPFVVAPTCKQESADAQKMLLCAARDAANAMASRIGGRLYCISSDGDSRRRNATRPLQKLGELALFDYHCGVGELTGNIDWKHIFKRLRNTLIRLLASALDGVVLTPQLIKQHLLRDSSLGEQRIDKLLAPNDRQNVKLMYDLLSAIAMLPEALESDTPTFRNNRRILRLLGAFYSHILEAHTNIFLSLHEQLVHISAAMHLMMAIYQKEAGRFVPSQTYFDFMTAGKTLFFCVAKPNSMTQRATFGTVRTISASDSNTDVAQLGSRLTSAVECDNILAEHPEWTRHPRRLKMPVWKEVAGDVSDKIDHINAPSWRGDTRVKLLSCKTTWMAGRGISEGELRAASWEPPFNSMEEAGGFSIFCPFGKNKMVLLDPPSAGERDEDEDEHDIYSPPPDAAETSGEAAALPPDSNTALLPDVEDGVLCADRRSRSAPSAIVGFLGCFR